MKTILFTAVMMTVAMANAKLIKDLPANDPLAKVGKAIGTTLNDGNISTGTTSLKVGLVKDTEGLDEAATLAKFAEKAFAEKFEDRTGEKLPKTAKLTTKAMNFVDGDGKSGTVYAMTSALMESNAYNDSEKMREQQAKYLWVVLRKLPVNAATSVAEIKTVLKDESSEENRTIRYFLLVNGDGKVVEFFTIEGTM